jgi:hypothetical protein
MNRLGYEIEQQKSRFSNEAALKIFYVPGTGLERVFLYPTHRNYTCTQIILSSYNFPEFNPLEFKKKEVL